MCKAAASEDFRGANDLAALRDSDSAAAVDGRSEAASVRARNMVTNNLSGTKIPSEDPQNIVSSFLAAFNNKPM